MRLPSSLDRAYRFVRQLIRNYSADRGSLMAAAVSFYVFLSMVPLALMAVAIAAMLLGSPERAQDIVLSYLRQYGPGVSDAANVESLVEEIVSGRGVATGFGLIVLLWTGTTVVAVLEQAINTAWGIPVRVGFVGQRLRAVLVMAIIGVLFVLSFGMSAALDTVRQLNIRLLGERPSEWSWMWSFLAYLVPFAVTVLTFTVEYVILPSAHVPFRVALMGGFFAGTAWELAKIGFAWYVGHIGGYSTIYGSLAGVILFLVWINYSAVITVLGAEVASMAAGRHAVVEE